MVHKAIIEGQVDGYTYKVRIPRYNQSPSSSYKTSYEELQVASVCCLPGTHPFYDTGDVVFVAFEDTLLTPPVILGQLYRVSETLSHTEIATKSLTVEGASNLNSVTIDQVAVKGDYFKNLDGNIQSKIGYLSDSISKQISDAFNSAQTYAAGDFCIYENTLYKFTQAKQPGEWNSSLVQATKITDELSGGGT